MLQEAVICRNKSILLCCALSKLVIYLTKFFFSSERVVDYSHRNSENEGMYKRNLLKQEIFFLMLSSEVRADH